MRLFRQGDVLLKQVDSLPLDCEPNRDNILAYGETTGHSHKIVGAKVLRRDKQLYVTVEEQAEILHEEHGRILLPTGLWQVVRQREYEAGSHKTRILTD